MSVPTLLFIYKMKTKKFREKFKKTKAGLGRVSRT